MQCSMKEGRCRYLLMSRVTSKIGSNVESKQEATRSFLLLVAMASNLPNSDVLQPSSSLLLVRCLVTKPKLEKRSEASHI